MLLPEKCMCLQKHAFSLTNMHFPMGNALVMQKPQAGGFKGSSSRRLVLRLRWPATEKKNQELRNQEEKRQNARKLEKIVVVFRSILLELSWGVSKHFRTFFWDVLGRDVVFSR